MLAILSLACGFVSKMLGAIFTFCSKPPGIYIAAACMIALAIWWSGQRGYDRGTADCEAAHKAASAAEQARQIAAAKTVRAASDARTAPHKAQAIANNETVRTIHVHDKALPDASVVCVNPDDADRLRDLR